MQTFDHRALIPSNSSLRRTCDHTGLMKRLLLLAVLFVPGIIPAQRVSFPVDKTSVVVKSDITSGYLYLTATVNGKRVRLILDTGAQMNVLTPEAAKKLEVPEGTPIQASGAGSQRVSASISQLRSMEVGGARVEGESVLIVDLPKVLEVDGLVGYGFFRHFVTTVDYESQQITFSKSETYQPDPSAAEIPMKMVNGTPNVEISVQGVQTWFHVDTGAGGNLVLFNPFVEANKLKDAYPNRLTTMTGMGVGGFTLGELTRMKTVKIGPYDLPELIVEFSSQKSGAFASAQYGGNIGYDVLRRFRLTLDAQKQKAYLTKSKAFNEPTLANRSGLFMDMKGKDHVVLGVTPKSPAADAKIEPGDILRSVNGKPASEIPAILLREYFRRPAGTKLEMTLQKKSGETVKVEVTLRELVP